MALADQYLVRGELQKAYAVGEELLTIGARTHNSEIVGRGRLMLATALHLSGNLSAAAEQIEQACRLPIGQSSIKDSLGWDWQIATRTLAANVWWPLGFPERAKAKSAESLELARNLPASPSGLMMTLFWSSIFNLQLRDWEQACPPIDEARRLADEHGLVGMLPMIDMVRGRALVRRGQVEEGLTEMLRWENVFKQAATIKLDFFHGLADIYLALGRAREGLQAVNDALQAVHAHGEVEAELHRLKGELLLIHPEGTVAEAAQCFHDAIEIARRQSAKSWELRATISLARLLTNQGCRDEARTMLAEIYNWFTEGFDTPDLKDAKALLDELAT